jgi:hypothetical protein
MYNFKEKQITTCGVVAWVVGWSANDPSSNPRFHNIFFVNFGLHVVTHMGDHALVGRTCGTMCWQVHMWDHALVGPCNGGAHMWDHALVGSCVGGTRTHNYTWLYVGPYLCYFSNCFVTITLLFYDASLLSSLVPHG